VDIIDRKTFFQSSSTDISPEAARSVWIEDASDELSEHIQEFFLAANIAGNGAICQAANEWKLEDEALDAKPNFNSGIAAAVKALRVEGVWVDRLCSIRDAMHWCRRSHTNLGGLPNTAAGRGLAYFSRLFSVDEHDDYIELILALAGLEAILTVGGRSSTGQLIENLSAITDSHMPKSFLEEKVKATYRARSVFLHGDVALPLRFCSPDLFWDLRGERLYPLHLFVVGVLMLIVKDLVCRDGQEYGFRTILMD
jgi:hypothetical protein